MRISPRNLKTSPNHLRFLGIFFGALATSSLCSTAYAFDSSLPLEASIPNQTLKAVDPPAITTPISPEEALRIAKEFMATHGDTLDAQDTNFKTRLVEQGTNTIQDEELRKEVGATREVRIPIELAAPATEEGAQIVSALITDTPQQIQPKTDPPSPRGQPSSTTSPAMSLSETIVESSPHNENQLSENAVVKEEMALGIEPSTKKDLSIRIEGFGPPLAPKKSLVETLSSEAPKASQNEGLPIPPPTLAIKADDIQLRASPSTTSLSLETNDTVLKAQVGVGYQFSSEKSATASYSIGTLLEEDVAVGGTITTGKYRTDLSANLIKQLGPQEYLSLSLGYMRGRESFKFFTGEAKPRLGQSSIGLEYRNKSELNHLGFTSFGLSIWGTQARQIDRFDALTKTVETETSFDTYLDPRRLSVGTLFGTSLMGSFRATKQLQIEPSIGYERLTFPFSDGTQELHRSQIASVDLSYSFNNGQSLLWSTRWGLSETRSSLGLKWGDWSFNIFHSQGEHGLHDSKGVTLNYALLNTENSRRTSAPPWSPISSLNLDVSQLADHAYGKETLLKLASARPVAFTRAWLAKIDPTSVRLIDSRPKVIPPDPPENDAPEEPAAASPSTTLSWSTTSLSKTYFDTGNPNRTAINFSVTASADDGSAITYSWGNDPDNLQATLTLDPATGVVTGSHPAVVNDKTYSFSITASANGVSTSSNNFSVIVKAPVRVRFTTAGATVELGSATTTATSITLPTDLTSIELLMVGGGGGGGAGNGGGGGAGSVLYAQNLSGVSGLINLSVGLGGSGANPTTNNATTTRGSTGRSTNFGLYTALGGGGGGSHGDADGSDGGSGGGTELVTSVKGQAIQVCPANFLCMGNAGGIAGAQYGYPGGGGGGATSPGVDASGVGMTAFVAGDGGDGFTVPASLGGGVVAGGGAGGYDLNDILNTGGLPDPGIIATGGSGVGGNGGSTGSGSSATANTGSGGGGGATGWLNGIYTRYAGGSGSDGLIIVRY